MSSSDNSNLDGGDVWEKVISKTNGRPYWFNRVTRERALDDPSLTVLEPAWIRTESRSKPGEFYWKNKSTGKTSWKEPADLSATMIKKARIIPPDDVKVAIIVPFRDIHPEQQRSLHLEKFLEHMKKFLKNCSPLKSSPSSSAMTSYQVYVIEQQPDDEHKFNRGKLLNVGFVQARNDGCNVFIFHDVDLLPSEELLPHYVRIPGANSPVHIARVWHRYRVNPHYFGGIVSFSKDMFERINGYPNNFWGWGGEDDELYSRTHEAKLTPIAPEAGGIHDLEGQLDLGKKLEVLREHEEWKCMNKDEVLREHRASWKTNGLADLKYRELARVDLGEAAVKITVDLGLNDHWTDRVCGINDRQIDSAPRVRDSVGPAEKVDSSSG